MSLKVKWRKWNNGTPPRRIKLEIPGWAGVSGHSNGDKPQPWHCPPFVAGSTYGLELIFPFSECRVSHKDGKLMFEGEFPTMADGNPPFMSFAPHHYGFTSSLDIQPPENYVVRTEPHPRFYTDVTGTCPIAVPGHLQRWWSRIFFIAFKSPGIGETHIFRKDEPYAQLLIVPTNVTYDIQEMDEKETSKRQTREMMIATIGSKHVAKNKWSDHKGNRFDDKYKTLSAAYVKGGEKAVSELLTNAYKSNQKIPKRMPRKLIFKNESLQNQKAKRKKKILHSGDEK